jgi:uncharacterized membrane protein HdeD (DUF308 family)
MTIMALTRNWWIVAIRGGLAMLFGASILLWPHRTLLTVVLLFGLYAVLDGVWAMATAGRASKQLVEMWPVGLEGIVSAVLGLLALVWPFISRELIYVIAGWGIVTGILEIVFALRVSSKTAGHWLLGTGGVCSLSLALLVLVLPHADIGPVATALGVYALLFGVVMFLAALGFRQRRVAIHARAAGA